MVANRQGLAGPQPRAGSLDDVFVQAIATPAGELADRARAGVLAMVFDLDAWRAWRPAARALLDGAESARVERLRHAAHRDALAMTYALHRLLLARVLGQAPREVAIQRDAKGCPRLPDDHWHTSLSHASGHAAFCVSRHGPVGVDLEPVARAAEVASIEERVLHPDDAARLATLQGVARGRALLELWVRKEALLKAAGIGLECDMEAFPAPLDAPLPLPGGRMAGRPSTLHAVDAGRGWVCALACPPGLVVSAMRVDGPPPAP